MRNIKSQSLAQLLLQLRFTPEEKRRVQLDAAEKLYAVIEPEKEYPFEFVCFRITGFHPTGSGADEIIKGEELLDDLRIFISRLSGRLARPAAEQDQKIYTIEELAEKFGISTKTIYRWRKRGLIARIFIFDDGRGRLGFLQPTVDKFLKANPDLAVKAKSFSRLTDEQKQQVVEQAEKLEFVTWGRSRSVRKQVLEERRDIKSCVIIEIFIKNYLEKKILIVQGNFGKDIDAIGRKLYFVTV